MKSLLISLSVALLVVLQNSALAEIEIREFPEEEIRINYQMLIDEIRCLVCQNQNLTASDADLARDLRQEIYEMLVAGNTVTEVKAFMVARYGEFVLYKPPLSPATWLIWIGPFILLGFGLFIAFRICRKSGTSDVPELNPSDTNRVNQLLGD